MSSLPSQIVIENVIQSKMRGRVVYQSTISSNIAFSLFYTKPFNHPSGKGYQRPVNKKRCEEISLFLSKGENSLFTPILLNAAGNWEFVPYDKNRSSFGRLLCQDKASLMDGQHRLGGIRLYADETGSEIGIPFLAFHYLDEDEEIELFDVINTKAKGIGNSLSKYLKRDSDDISWIATELIVRKDSPFHDIGSITGIRRKGRHVTLQNLYKVVGFLFNNSKLRSLGKFEKLLITMFYYNEIKELFNAEWSDYKDHRLSHIVCLNALAIAGEKMITLQVSDELKTIDYEGISKSIKKLRRFNWSSQGGLKYLKGISGSKTLSEDLIARMKV